MIAPVSTTPTWSRLCRLMHSYVGIKTECGCVDVEKSKLSLARRERQWLDVGKFKRDWSAEPFAEASVDQSHD